MKVTLHKLGDFYEAFDSDAETLARELGITLTTSHDGRKLAGIPYWAIARDTATLEARGIQVTLA